MDREKKSREIEFTQYLDPPENQTELRARIRATEYHKSIESFSVSQRSVIWGEPREIIRFDCSEKESVNVHKFFKRPPEKRYLDKPKTYDTVSEAISDIEKNWRIYKSRYEEKH